MPTLDALISKIVKEGKKPIKGEDESKEERNDQSHGPSPWQEARKEKKSMPEKVPKEVNPFASKLSYP